MEPITKQYTVAASSSNSDLLDDPVYVAFFAIQDLLRQMDWTDEPVEMNKLFMMLDVYRQ